RPDGIDDLPGEDGNALDLAAVRGHDGAKPPVRDDEIGAVHAAAQLLHHGFDRRIAVGPREPRFRLVDADEVGARIFGDEIEAAVGAIGLRVDGEEAGLVAEYADQRV